jgi:membrane-bound lytic murein transglycosylase
MEHVSQKQDYGAFAHRNLNDAGSVERSEVTRGVVIRAFAAYDENATIRELMHVDRKFDRFRKEKELGEGVIGFLTCQLLPQENAAGDGIALLKGRDQGNGALKIEQVKQAVYGAVAGL